VHHLNMKAYSVDLREKIVSAVRRGMSKAQAARTFGVNATSVKRYVKLTEERKRHISVLKRASIWKSQSSTSLS